MRALFKSIYDYIETLPDRLYPFASEIEGRWVRGRESYTLAVKHALTKYGVGRLGYKLVVYRQTFHFIGSILFLIIATVISNVLFGSESALIILLCVAVALISFQEFYLHPKRYGQLRHKGVADWFVWMTPIALYAIFFLV
ncbi:MAG: hypothetical protein WDZ68_01705 [Candidatus Paceibacterota bacterium]